MVRGHTVVKWQVLLEDTDWDSEHCPPIPQLSAEDPLATPISRRHCRLLWSVVGVILVAAMSGGYLLWRTAQAGLQLIETELEHTLVLEEWTAALHPTSQGTDVAQLPALSTPSRLNVYLESFDLSGEVACAEVVVEDAHFFSPYRETRFYHQTEMGWQRTAAPASFWGAQQQLGSEHFIFLASQRDLPIAAEIAPVLDAFYTRTCLDLGLPPAGGEKIIVEFLPNPSEKINLFIVDNRLQAPSLALRQIPVDLSETEILIQLIKVSLVRHLLNQVAATWLKDLEGPMNWTWGTVRTGIVSWLTWDKESLLGQKFEVLIGWFYQEGKGAHLYEAELLPANYQEFCQICDMLGVTPHDLGIPFACTGDVDIDGILYYAFPPLTADLLDLGDPFPVAAPAMIRDRQDLAEYQSQGNGRLIHSFLGKNITIFTLFDYTVHTYGRETLPVLLAASGAHSQLYTAIPAVYGVSLAEFEEDWRTYLQEKYASE